MQARAAGGGREPCGTQLAPPHIQVVLLVQPQNGLEESFAVASHRPRARAVPGPLVLPEPGIWQAARAGGGDGGPERAGSLRQEAGRASSKGVLIGLRRRNTAACRVADMRALLTRALEAGPLALLLLRRRRRRAVAGQRPRRIGLLLDSAATPPLLARLAVRAQGCTQPRAAALVRRGEGVGCQASLTADTPRAAVAITELGPSSAVVLWPQAVYCEGGAANRVGRPGESGGQTHARCADCSPRSPGSPWAVLTRVVTDSHRFDRASRLSAKGWAEGAHEHKQVEARVCLSQHEGTEVQQHRQGAVHRHCK